MTPPIVSLLGRKCIQLHCLLLVVYHQQSKYPLIGANGAFCMQIPTVQIRKWKWFIVRAARRTWASHVIWANWSPKPWPQQFEAWKGSLAPWLVGPMSRAPPSRPHGERWEGYCSRGGGGWRRGTRRRLFSLAILTSHGSRSLWQHPVVPTASLVLAWDACAQLLLWT